MTHSIRVVPAVLTDDPKALKTMLQQAETFTDYVQIDIMDGKFVPSRSITREQITGIPLKMRWEVHLMVEQPEKQLEDYQKAGASKAIFHYEATSSPREVILSARKSGLAIGLAVNPETSVFDILPLVDEIDSVLFLAVHPGFYGAKFIPEVLDKITELRQARPALSIGIDGGIKENNIARIAQGGVNEIFVGSAIFLQPNPAESYHRLVSLVNA